VAESAIPYAVAVCYGYLAPGEDFVKEAGTPCPASAADSILTGTHIRNHLTGLGGGVDDPHSARYQLLGSDPF